MVRRLQQQAVNGVAVASGAESDAIALTESLNTISVEISGRTTTNTCTIIVGEDYSSVVVARAAEEFH